MSHKYENEFFDYIENGSILSAREMVPIIMEMLHPNSILDVGCGRGAWLSVWKEAGVERVKGVDGMYLSGKRLMIDESEIIFADLSNPFELGEKFDLVVSLEVAEHLPEASAHTFISSLCRHGDMVLFSAATKGQGGEYHVNEQPLSYWQAIFDRQGYLAFDIVREQIRGNANIKPWYKYNTVLYIKKDAVPEKLRGKHAMMPLEDGGDALWQLRCALFRYLPVSWVTWLARLNAKMHGLVR